MSGRVQQPRPASHTHAEIQVILEGVLLLREQTTVTSVELRAMI
jgi:hypothetical protein